MKLSKLGCIGGLLLSTILFPCALGDFSDIVLTNDTFMISSSTIGPYELGSKNQDISFTVLYQTVGNYRPRFKAAFDNEINFAKVFPLEEISTKFTKISYTITLPLETSLNENGFTCEFSIYDSLNVKMLTSILLNIKTLIPSTYNTSDYDKLSFSKGGYAYKINNNNIINYTETISCSNFMDYFDIDYYYRLPLDQFTFTCSSALTVPTATASLNFVDFQNNFPYIEKSLFGQISLPLVMKKTDSTFSLRYEENLYVNTKTLQMSTKPYANFVPTNTFFLPVNCMQNLNETSFIIKINEFGNFKTTINWKVRLLTNKTLIGDCSTSEYCVTGEVV